ncbi:MAG TPA: hypothetical protein VNN20_01815 [Thermodesulfobacteriota bacterium]|nr:hypothetical protein [Thermodesulfobacteriota bacterium]
MNKLFGEFVLRRAGSWLSKSSWFDGVYTEEREGLTMKEQEGKR